MVKVYLVFSDWFKNESIVVAWSTLDDLFYIFDKSLLGYLLQMLKLSKFKLTLFVIAGCLRDSLMVILGSRGFGNIV